MSYTRSQSVSQPKDTAYHRSSLTISYYGETITHPGFRLGYEYLFAQKDALKIKKNGNTIDIRNSFILGGSVTTYYHKRNHLGLLTSAELGYKKIRKKGFKYEIFLGIGYLHTFLVNDTYKINNSGVVERVSFAGQSNFCPSISFGIGKDLSFKNGKNWSWHIKNHFCFQIPFSSTYLFHRGFEIGLSYYLK